MVGALKRGARAGVPMVGRRGHVGWLIFNRPKALNAMNATMMVVCLPVGLAAMVSGLRQGENLRFSAQMLALTGLFGAIWQTQGAQLVAMI